MTAVAFLPFEKDDCVDVLAFWSGMPGIRLNENGEDSVGGITAYLDRNPGFSFIAKQEGRIIGALMCGHDGRRGFIYHLAVNSRHRGCGIGKTLVRLSLEQLQAAGIKKCALFVLKTNTEAEAFYQSIQWDESSNVKIYVKAL